MIFCYFKPEAYVRLASTSNPTNLNKEHTPTSLSVPSDGKGYYVMLSCDLYQEPDYVPREDLTCDIGWYSAKIAVDMPIYTNSKIQTGNYDCGDPEVILVISREIKNSDGVLHRVMTVKAPTWEKLKTAIAKIRSGEITPVSREQTVLESLQGQLAEMEDRFGRFAGTELCLTAELNRLRTFAMGAAKHLPRSSNFYSMVWSAMYPDEIAAPQVLEAILEETGKAYRGRRERDNIKATWWYRTCVALRHPIRTLNEKIGKSALKSVQADLDMLETREHQFGEPRKY